MSILIPSLSKFHNSIILTFVILKEELEPKDDFLAKLSSKSVRARANCSHSGAGEAAHTFMFTVIYTTLGKHSVSF